MKGGCIRNTWNLLSSFFVDDYRNCNQMFANFLQKLNLRNNGCSKKIFFYISIFAGQSGQPPKTIQLMPSYSVFSRIQGMYRMSRPSNKSYLFVFRSHFGHVIFFEAPGVLFLGTGSQNQWKNGIE